MKHFVAIFALFLAAGMTHAQFTNPQSATPAFHSSAPAATEKLPPILTQKELAASGLIAPAQVEAYKAAAKASSIAYQMPCYCYCDRGHGHKSLRSCFESTHGANCSTCMQEALYTYQQSRKGVSARVIREGIVRGDYKLIDLENVTPVK
jgi:hypothetical protein